MTFLTTVVDSTVTPFKTYSYTSFGNRSLFLCSDRVSFITRSNVPIDGGFVTLKM